MARPAPIIVAHRGLHRVCPENSLLAFTSAWDLPLDWVECDVYELGDGAIVLHDDTLDRTTELTGPVYDRAACQLRNCRLRDARGQVTSHVLPRLQQVTAAMPPHGKLMVEIKGSAIADFMPGLMREVRRDSIIIQSFDPKHLLLASRYDRLLPIAYLVESEQALADALDSSYSAVHLRHHMLDEKIARNLRQKGKSIGAWTVNDPADIQRMIDLGIDMLITDEPELAMEICRIAVAPKGH